MLNLWSRRDKLTEIKEIPQCAIGAPAPIVIAKDNRLFLAYALEADNMAALIEFVFPLAHYLGPPNDETLSGHRLFSKGLRPHAVFEVTNSTWIQGCVDMNTVHPQHNAAHFARFKHYIFTFHDTTFECLAEGFRLAQHPATDMPAILQAL